MPLWVTNPPLDDELNIYIVGSGNDEEINLSVINQLYERFEIKDNPYFTNLLLSYLNEPDEDNVSILDRWKSDVMEYVLVRIKRSFFSPILELYTVRYDEMVNYRSEYEVLADEYFEAGDYFSAFNLYKKSLEKMLLEDDEFFTPSILKNIDKIKNILNVLTYSNIQLFKELIIDKPIDTQQFSFDVGGEESINLDGFIYTVEFMEGWNNRVSRARIPIRGNSLLFIPPIPKKSGISTLTSKILLDELIEILSINPSNNSLVNSLLEFKEYINGIVSTSTITFDFQVRSDLNFFPKLIAFENEFVQEGVLRFLLNVGDQPIESPLLKKDMEFITYVRDVNSITSNEYQYLIFSEDLMRETIPFDEDGIVVKMTTTFSLVDLQSSFILETQSVSSEFIGRIGEEDLAYLDLGLKIGEVINKIKF